MAPITHVVSFRFNPASSSAERHLIASSFLALQDQCIIDGNTYLSVTGGRSNSSEGFEKGFDHTYVVTFDTVEQRDYYVEKDPAHTKFKELAKGHVVDLFVFDFEGGVF
ncbi:hypothetical protein JCM3770_006875 [Rhodotorula araucariae]